MNSKSLLLKRGRPTKYTTALPDRVNHYTKRCLKKGDFPTIERLAMILGVGTRTIYDWETVYPDFSQTLEKLRDAQRHLLVTNGLNDKWNARFATFLLKASHGFTDAKPMIEATQNNIFNVSPELLADALQIIEDQKKLKKDQVSVQTRG